MADIRHLLEAMDKFAGEKVGQKPGDQVTGTEKATKKKRDGHPFKGRLVGEGSGNLLKDLEETLITSPGKRDLEEEYNRFKQELDEFVPPDGYKPPGMPRGGDGSGDGGGEYEGMTLEEVAKAIMMHIGDAFTVVKGTPVKGAVGGTVQTSYKFIPRDPTKFRYAKIWSLKKRGQEMAAYNTFIEVPGSDNSKFLKAAESGVLKTNANALRTAELIYGNTNEERVNEIWADQQGPEQEPYRVIATLVDKNATAVTKRNEQISRTVRVNAVSDKEAEELAVDYYMRKGYKVIDVESQGPMSSLREGSKDHNPQDVITTDVPLLIRLLEYAREDAKTDMDLHNVAERMIKLSSEGRPLSMDDYDAICPGKKINEFAIGKKDDGSDEFDSGIAKRAQEDGHVKGFSLGDNVTLARAVKINSWDEIFGGMYKHYFAKGWKSGRLNKIAMDQKQHGITAELIPDGSIQPQNNANDRLSEAGANPIPPVQPNAPVGTAPGQADPLAAQKMKQQQLDLQKNLTNLKSAGVDIDPMKASQTLTKAGANAPLNPADQATVSKMAPQLGNIMKNPQLAGQFKQLVTKASQPQPGAPQQRTM